MPLSSKQRGPDPNSNSFNNKRCCKHVERNPLCVDVSFRIKDSSLGLWSLCVLHDAIIIIIISMIIISWQISSIIIININSVIIIFICYFINIISIIITISSSSSSDARDAEEAALHAAEDAAADALVLKRPQDGS